ncbi:acyltransferase [Paenibacillus sp. LHD-117]|uniref:acyltransferase n=1 Tax=Paenibacillus sp. LHD-117 TaxID=3071412 RepID=UPI0027DF4052|nr:acyltransferase [Paenibacillus sp. LHD-117]MDQ6419463.1 acyltransferase [Paenibacillus sp. LHD-117]
MNQLPIGTIRRARITELDLVRAVAIFGVLAVHATSFATMEMKGTTDTGYFLYNFANIFMKFGTPVFIFLSSFVLFLRYQDRPFARETFVSFYRKRLIHIIIPYTVFSTIYYIAVAVTRTEAERPTNFALDYLGKLATGTAYSHLYFVFISIQFYLLFPLVLWLFRAYPRLAAWAIPVGLAIQWGFYGADQLADIPYIGSWAFSYFSFYMLGAYAGSKYELIRGWVASQNRTSTYRFFTIALWVGWSATGLLHSWIWFQLRAHGVSSPQQLFQLLWSVFAFLSAIAFTQAAFHAEKRFAHSRTVRVLKLLGTYTFGIYLLHPLLLAVYREFRPTGAEPYVLHLWYAGGFLLALFGTWVIVAFAQRHVPFAWLFFGKNEERNTRAEGVKKVVSG